jgi:hypothetical protein
MTYISWYKILDEKTSLINTVNEISKNPQYQIDSFSQDEEIYTSQYIINVDKAGRTLDQLLGWQTSFLKLLTSTSLTYNLYS